jgi:transposase
MYRIRLDDAARRELRRRAHEAGVMPRTRDRLEMVRLSDVGWSIPRIAQHFGMSERCVRRWIKTFLSEGFDALPDKPHVGQKSALSPQMLAAIRTQVSKGERTWTAPQIADWLEQHFALRLSAPWISRRLRRERIAYKRTSRTLGHKQNKEQLAHKSADLETLEKGAMRD